MFEQLGATSAATLQRLVAGLGQLDQDVDDAIRIDRIRALEEIKAAAAAAQARETAAFATSQRVTQQAAGVPAERAHRGIALEVGLARRISHHGAARYVGWSIVLTQELPATFAALAAGRVPEFRALVVARETMWLSREHRAAVDAELAPRLHQLGDKRVEAETRKLAYRLDPHGYVSRIRGAATDRRVSVRPAPETMARLGIFVPVAQGVAAYAALGRDADSKIAAGDPRGRGQIMADTAVERLTGQARADDVPVEVHLVMTDTAFLAPHGAGSAETPPPTRGARLVGEDAGEDEPAHLDGYGPIPAQLAREMVFGVRDSTPMWLRRLFRHPITGELVAMERKRRCFSAEQRQFLRIRDQVCRTPWCEAPIRQADHVVPADASGPTHLSNGAGLCSACNYAKQAPGWSTVPLSITHGQHAYTITTPTGHVYSSRPPAPPGRSTALAPVVRNLHRWLRSA